MRRPKAIAIHADATDAGASDDDQGAGRPRAGYGSRQPVVSLEGQVIRVCQEITDLFGSPARRPNRVVPVAMETMPLEQDRRHLRVRDRHAARVAPPIDLGPDAQS